jgi:hypothetical protein
MVLHPPGLDLTREYPQLRRAGSTAVTLRCDELEYPAELALYHPRSEETGAASR